MFSLLIEFTILDIRQDVSQVPAFWYGDEEGATVQEIINNLNKGLKLICVDEILNDIRLLYNKKMFHIGYYTCSIDDFFKRN